MVKKIVNSIRDGIASLAGCLFALVAAPIIHRSGLDNVDSCPSPEDIARANKLAAKYKSEQRSVGEQR